MRNLISTCSSIWLLDWDALNFYCADPLDSPCLVGRGAGLGQVAGTSRSPNVAKLFLQDLEKQELCSGLGKQGKL